MRSLLLYALAIMIAFPAMAQSGAITGQVTGTEGEELVGITVQLQDKPSTGAATAANGRYTITGVPAGRHVLIISGMGYVREEKEVSLKAGETLTVNVILSEDITELDQVVVFGKTKAEELREQAYNVEVIEAKGFRDVSTDVNQILNRVSGINLREEGGLGSGFTLSLNGLSGNQVRTFIDGVPMDYFGNALTLNNFPANLIQQVEVYKGVVPIHLSSDALGGAINVVTNRTPGDFLDASYAYGSFNTHRAAVNAQMYDTNTGLTFRTRSFYNKTDNNYDIDVRLIGEGGVPEEEPTEVERFHDGYRSAMVQVEGGVMQKSWADELMLGVLYSDNFNEIQQTYGSSTYNPPLGEVTQEENSLIGNLTYRKRDIIKGLDINTYAVMVRREQLTTDTSSHRYDWLGGRLENQHPTTGEAGRKSRFLLEDRNFLSNTNIQYRFANNHMVAANFSVNRLTREGEDDYHPQNATQFSEPSTTDKKVLGLSYSQHFWEEKLNNTFFIKNYFFTLNSLETSWNGEEKNLFEKQIDRFGFGAASTYQVSPAAQVKLSYERTIRYPEPLELFGNGLLVVPNPTLGPESSHNVNLGFRISNAPALKHQIHAEGNFFYRDSEDFIRVESRGILSNYVNEASVSTKGVDMTLNYRYNERFNAGLNFTYQDIRNTSEWLQGVVGGTRDPYNGDRVPNIPYLFGNVVLSYRIPDLFQKDDAFSIASIQRYVHEYYLFWPSQGSRESKNVIPEQLTQNVELVYSIDNGRYNLSFTISNLWDADVYDNFNLQKPGRAFSLKARYFISKY
ncbi:carboxypeptidase-like regulatory domain-containing protein [Roseivirga sp. BDSF3-8]|uniref:TonB-dependent receptor n=1 Tax=Roseivirga sp. BDSF3-8 TaxID=3241598 RepID=UPI003531E181